MQVMPGDVDGTVEKIEFEAAPESDGDDVETIAMCAYVRSSEHPYNKTRFVWLLDRATAEVVAEELAKWAEPEGKTSS